MLGVEEYTLNFDDFFLFFARPEGRTRDLFDFSLFSLHSGAPKATRLLLPPMKFDDYTSNLINTVQSICIEVIVFIKFSKFCTQRICL